MVSIPKTLTNFIDPLTDFLEHDTGWHMLYQPSRDCIPLVEIINLQKSIARVCHKHLLWSTGFIERNYMNLLQIEEQFTFHYFININFIFHNAIFLSLQNTHFMYCWHKIGYILRRHHQSTTKLRQIGKVFWSLLQNSSPWIMGVVLKEWKVNALQLYLGDKKFPVSYGLGK